jgi:hypothetical protein
VREITPEILVLRLLVIMPVSVLWGMCWGFWGGSRDLSMWFIISFGALVGAGIGYGVNALMAACGL